MTLESYQLELKNIALSAKFGFLEAEQNLFQRIYVDLVFDIRAEGHAIKDDLSTVYDYSNVLNIATKVLGQRSFRLLEDLSNCLAKAYFVDDRVLKLLVIIRKPSVPLDGVLDYVSTQMTYRNE
jgi:dihydroneopterin aldolase